MNRKKLSETITLAIAGLCLVACGSADETPSKTTMPSEDTAVIETKQVTPKAEPQMQNISAEDALLRRGRIVWIKCRSCHETSAEGPNKVGPSLYGIMQAKAGVKEGFVYSKALKNSEIVWTDESLDAFLEKPSSYVKGTKMAFVGIKNESDRQAVIAYIKENTKLVE